MSCGCPGKDEWLVLIDGEATENRAAFLRAHAHACAACARELQLQRQLLADLSAPVPVSPGAAQAILARLPMAPTIRQPGRRRWAVAGGALLLVMVAGMLLVPHEPTDPDTFVARGQKVPWTQKVGVEVFTLGRSLRKLAPGARVSPGLAIVASYDNVDSAPAFLMVFGCDAHGELHWAYPGFNDANSDPTSVRMEALQTRRVLPDSVVLDALPLGPLELISLITRAPVHVSRIEALPPAYRTPAGLRRRFPEARITSVPLQVVELGPASKEKP
jgi:hypothetical protein